MTERNLFLLGLGNQKCGTSWLHKYLSESPNFRDGVAKEYHVWDALDNPLKKDSLVSWKAGFIGMPIKMRRYRMQRKPSHYFDYFSSLYSDTVTVTADITPSYSGLEPARLTYIQDEFDRKGVDTKAIILIREPVARIKSAVRYCLDRKNYREGITSGETDFFRAARQYFQSPHCQYRTNYHVSIENALKVFGEEDLYVGLYETMFSAEEIERVSKFCNVPVNTEYASVRVNKTKSKVAEDEALEAEIRAAYQPVYDYCYERFPETRELWA